LGGVPVLKERSSGKGEKGKSLKREDTKEGERQRVHLPTQYTGERLSETVPVADKKGR